MKILILIFALLSFHFSFAQLGYTRSEIIDKNGSRYETGVANDGFPYFFYIKPESSAVSGYYQSYNTFYFNKEGICSMMLVSEPVAEANSWVATLNKRYVKLAELEWKDYATGKVIIITTDESLVNVYFYTSF